MPAADNWIHQFSVKPFGVLSFRMYSVISQHTDATAYLYARYGQGSGPILLDDVACTGTENALVNCTYDSSTSDCSHYEDAGVLCQSKHCF